MAGIIYIREANDFALTPIRYDATDGTLHFGGGLTAPFKFAAATTTRAIDIQVTPTTADRMLYMDIDYGANNKEAAYIISSSAKTSGETTAVRARGQGKAVGASTAEIRGVHGQGIAFGSLYAGTVNAIYAEAIAKTASTVTTLRGIMVAADSEGTPTSITTMIGAHVRIKTSVAPGTAFEGIRVESEKFGSGVLSGAAIRVVDTTWGAAETPFTAGLHLNTTGIITTGVLIASPTVDGIRISGACTDNGIEITGSCTDSAFQTGTGTFATGITLGGTLTTGIAITGTATTGISVTGAFTGTALEIGVTGTAMTLTNSSHALSIVTSHSATTGTVRSAEIIQAMLVDDVSTINEVLYVNFDSAKTTGDWTNAIVGRINYTAPGKADGGMAAAICSEISLPAAAQTGGSYYSFDAEMECPASFTCAASAANPVAFMKFGVWGDATAIDSFEAGGYLFHIDGVADTSGGLFELEDVDDPKINGSLKINIGGTDYFIPLGTDKAFQD